jgi:hypothetical protein
MRRRILASFVMLGAVAILATPVHAQGFGSGGGATPPPAPPAGDGTSQIVNYPFAGKTSEVTVPAGWTSTQNDNGTLVFSAPADKVTGTLYVLMLAVDATEGATIDTLAPQIATLFKDNQMPYGKAEDPSDFDFMGAAGKGIVLRGVNPETKAADVALVVTAIDGKKTLVCIMFGTSADIQTNSEDLASIVVSARFVTPQPVAHGGHNGPRKSGSAPPPVDDPTWGLEITGLDGDWRMEAQKGAYVYATTKVVPATITVRHAWADPSYTRKLHGKPTKVGKVDAIVVEGKNERTYHIIVGQQATEIELVSPRRDEAEAKVLPTFVRGLKINEVDPPRRKARTGVNMALANGVHLQLGKGWAYEDSFAAGGNYSNGSGRNLVYVQLRTSRRVKGGGAPFAAALASVKVRCADFRGAYLENETTLGGRKARRVTCTPKKGSSRQLAPMTAIVTGEGEVAAFVFATTTARSLAEPRVKEFLAGVVLP